RIRSIRSEIVLKCFGESVVDISVLKAATKLVVLCQELITFDDDYLIDGGVTDTRLVETIQRLQEICFGKARQNFPLHAVIQFGDQIDVPAGKSPRGQRDPLVEGIRDQLEDMLVQLSQEALPC
ncbi:MAG: 1-acyl-sn-glycerol-3-phosphate acyltransferase, partial [Planctomycetota bacterium]|nr:1-acyl-sn-glycerol-3-phosphate acyltransferase [Planctomycetota bacterium]